MSNVACFVFFLLLFYLPMIITYYGIMFFRVQVGDTIIAFNPPSKDSKYKPNRFGADVCFISLNHKDTNGVSTVTLGEKKPIIIQGPGEYEVKGIFARGLPSISKYDGEKRINTIYSVNFEGLHLVYLGAAIGPSLSADVEEGLDNIDVLFVPIGGGGVLSVAEADKVSVTLEPKLIIPMHYGTVGAPGALKNFLKEGGAEGTKEVDKLTLKRKDLDGKEGEIIVLASV